MPHEDLECYILTLIESFPR